MLGWITIDRKLLEWQWHDDPHMVALLVHLLLSANYEPKRWRDIVIERGQLVVGRRGLAEATGISEQTIRTCLGRMVNDGTITIKSTNKYSIVTISKYDEYQRLDDDNQPTNQPTTNHQLTTTKQINNNIITTTSRVYACEEAKGVLVKWDSWAEMICMKLQIKPYDYPQMVSNFLQEQRCQCKIWESENDIKAHFYNWLKMPERSAKPVQKKVNVSQAEAERIRIAESEERQRQYLEAKAKRAEAPVFTSKILLHLNNNK